MSEPFRRIANDRFEAVIAPHWGGRLAAFRTAGGTDLVMPLNGWTAGPRGWPKGGGYPLIPYSNRIANSVLHHGGEVFAIEAHPDAAPHSLHGPAHLEPWTVTASDAASVSLVLDREADAHWPWRFKADQRFALTEDGLTVTIGIENTGEDDFPAGIGWHPYFPWPAGASLTHDARIVWERDADFVATGERRPANAADGMPEGDTKYFSDWNEAVLDLGAAGRLVMTPDAIFSHLVVHQPAGIAYICAEPVSHLADGFNLAERGVRGTGTLTLPAGKRISGDIVLSYRGPQ